MKNEANAQESDVQIVEKQVTKEETQQLENSADDSDDVVIVEGEKEEESLSAEAKES